MSNNKSHPTAQGIYVDFPPKLTREPKVAPGAVQAASSIVDTVSNSIPIADNVMQSPDQFLPPLHALAVHRREMRQSGLQVILKIRLLVVKLCARKVRWSLDEDPVTVITLGTSLSPFRGPLVSHSPSKV